MNSQQIRKAIHRTLNRIRRAHSLGFHSVVDDLKATIDRLMGLFGK